MTRLLGFLIEGIARGHDYVFRIVLPDSIREAAEADLATLNARAGVDYTLHSPADAGQVAEDPAALAGFANDHVDVAGWLSIFPTFTFAKLLKAPVTTIFPDAIPTVFHEFSDLAWGDAGNHVRWRDSVADMLASVDRVVTFSRHVAERQATGIFGVPPAAIRVVPHASPDLQDLLPFMKDRRKTRESIAQAADMLRGHARAHGLLYLRDFPFEDVPYIAVSTADRVTKNLRLVAEALERLQRQERISIKVIMTALIHFGADWTPLPGLIERAQNQFDFLSMPDLPRDVHAAFYHCAAVAVHPSIFEGGHAPFPFYEAVSVGTPCLMASGPHVAEIAELQPGFADHVFDPNDPDRLVALIRDVLDDPAPAIAHQQHLFARLSDRGWDEVATGYARAATEHMAAGTTRKREG